MRTSFALMACVTIAMGGIGRAGELHVSPAGDDGHPGTIERPLRTLEAARKAARRVRAAADGPVTVVLHRGRYELSGPLVLTAEDSGTREAPLVFASAPGEEAVVSGAARLELAWEPDRGGVFKARVPEGLATDQLFVDGELQHLARHPDYDPAAAYFGGTAADAIDKSRAARWADPKGGYIHAMHRHMWGDFHYLITGKASDGTVSFEGGWQNNRRLGMHDTIRFVENIREELDAPGEWFLDGRAHVLYFLPPRGLDLRRAVVEAVRLRHLVELRGSADRSVRFVAFRGLTFRHAARTFMDNKEPLLRSDWTIYRGGAIVFEGTEDCALEDCVVDRVGGNAVLVSNYNRRAAIRGCQIVGAGANGVAFVGDPRAVRSPLFEYGQRQAIGQVDRTPGPRSPDYPADCRVEDCLIHRTGRIEKQSAPVEIAMARRITVRHCSIYDVPRAGINVGDGCWGGHLVEFCDVFDTVKETGDHGSFNSWGRDRYWRLKGIDPNAITAGKDRELPSLDTVEPIVLRNNRWRCDHGWDIDLDDGSTNYEIRDNLCLNGGIKLREGFYRTVENNIMVNNSFHPHAWFRGSEDVFRRNIVFATYRPIEMKTPWSKECDFNWLHVGGWRSTVPARDLMKQSGRDDHSIIGDARFNVATGVQDNSPALRLGFRNFPMDRFGVQKPALKAIARTPELPGAPWAPMPSLLRKQQPPILAVMEREHRPRARWKTISLRGLLLLVLAIALWLGWIVHKARQQREAVAALQKFGGFVHYDWEFVDGPVKVPRGNLLWKPTWGKLTPGRKPWAPDWLRRAVGDEYFQSIAHVSLYVDIKKGQADASWVNMGPADDALRKLATQTRLRTLQIGGEQVTDDNLADVGRMTGLEELNISWGYHLTDEGFRHLSGLKRLRILEVDHSKMTDAGLAAIGKLTNLEELRIGGAGFSDRGLAQLKGLTSLKYLSLGEGKHTISDAGLESLKGMTELEYLDLGGWQVSDEGIAKLRELKNLKSVHIDLAEDQGDRRKRMQGLLPGVVIE